MLLTAARGPPAHVYRHSRSPVRALSKSSRSRPTVFGQFGPVASPSRGARLYTTLHITQGSPCVSRPRVVQTPTLASSAARETHIPSRASAHCVRETVARRTFRGGVSMHCPLYGHSTAGFVPVPLAPSRAVGPQSANGRVLVEEIFLLGGRASVGAHCEEACQEPTHPCRHAEGEEEEREGVSGSACTGVAPPVPHVAVSGVRVTHSQSVDNERRKLSG